MSIEPLIDHLLAQLPDDDQPTVISVQQNNTSVSSTAPPDRPRVLEYEPGVVCILELSTRLLTKAQELPKDAAKKVFDTLQGILRHPNQHHPTLVARTTFYSLKLLRASYVSITLSTTRRLELIVSTQQHDLANTPYLLHTISSLPKDLLLGSSGFIISGLSYCTEEPGPLRSEIMTSPDFWSTLRILAQDPISAADVFLILEKGSLGNPPAILADNYEAAISLMNDFANVSGVPEPLQKRTEQREARQTAEKPKL